MIERADYVIDIGPKAGKYGGEIISKGTFRLKHHTACT
jgi:excinuclease ABC subunit A